MASFKDSSGQEWDLPNLDALLIRKIRLDCDPDFLKGNAATGYDSTFDRLMSDPVLLCGVIYLLCDGQRRERGVTQEQFYTVVIGDAIEEATTALLETVRSFSPRRTRQLLDAAAKQNQLKTEAVNRLAEKLADPKTTNQIMEDLERKLLK